MRNPISVSLVKSHTILVSTKNWSAEWAFSEFTQETSVSSALLEDKQAPAKIMEGSCGFFVSVSSPLLFLLFFIKYIKWVNFSLKNSSTSYSD